MNVSTRSITESLNAAFYNTDIAQDVASADVRVIPGGYSVLVSQRATAHRIAAHIIESFGADPESGNVTVQIDLGVFVNVTVARPAPVAERVTYAEAREHFAAGGTVLVSEHGEQTVTVTPSTTTHTRETTTWETLTEMVSTWMNRYPRQAFYVVPSA